MAARNTISQLTSRIDELTQRLAPISGLITIEGAIETSAEGGCKRSRRQAG